MYTRSYLQNWQSTALKNPTPPPPPHTHISVHHTAVPVFSGGDAEAGDLGVIVRPEKHTITTDDAPDKAYTSKLED